MTGVEIFGVNKPRLVLVDLVVVVRLVNMELCVNNGPAEVVDFDVEIELLLERVLVAVDVSFFTG